MSATVRSSVRPKSSKQPWGTVIKPEYGLGYQKMTAYEVSQTVDRLSQKRPQGEPILITVPQKEMKKSDQVAMIERLNTNEKTPDTKRTMRDSSYKNMGVVSSYAWKGWY
ncbi:unnamed protein product [Owenia fusiformis]|uniref:Uncharacterized protein n=1 Tax=Owenia fusiformis TaxID=6347 RepID=A0A8J1TYS7_OWEFU|nr:unnamed protein product [Owenia fusiformis]